MNETQIAPEYDVVIIGSGIAGAILAKQLGKRGKKILILEAGVALPSGREALMEKFFLDLKKFPEAPYPDNPNAPRATVEHLIGNWQNPLNTYLDHSASRMPFGSTYERRGGGTMWHWMGTSLRFLPNDFLCKSNYQQAVDWPIRYEDLAITPREVTPDGHKLSYYDLAEDEIGVSANVEDQDPGNANQLFAPNRQYPMPAIPLSRGDQFFQKKVEGMSFDGQPVRVIPTPAGRNSRPYKTRRVCAGNTNCVPICPIEAKYDPTVTLHEAFNHQNVSAQFQSVATKLIYANGKIEGVEYVRYDTSAERSASPAAIVRGRIYVVAANAIESPKLLLLSNLGEVNPNIGKNLMDHPFYLRWGLTPEDEPIYPYRGPLSTAGLDSLRDGKFRRERAAFRIEIGNDGWGLAVGDPATTLLDHIEGVNGAGLFGRTLIERLRRIYLRQCRIGFELEQLPDPGNRVELSNLTDALGIRRPKIQYSVSDYEAKGFAAASKFTDQLFTKLGIEDKTEEHGLPTFGRWEGKKHEFMGAGHIIGTCRMGKTKEDSVVDQEQRSHDCKNLFIVGSSVFPTSGTANPTLTLAALAFWAADTIAKDLDRG